MLLMVVATLDTFCRWTKRPRLSESAPYSFDVAILIVKSLTACRSKIGFIKLSYHPTISALWSVGSVNLKKSYVTSKLFAFKPLSIWSSLLNSKLGLKVNISNSEAPRMVLPRLEKDHSTGLLFKLSFATFLNVTLDEIWNSREHMFRIVSRMHVTENT